MDVLLLSQRKSNRKSDRTGNASGIMKSILIVYISEQNVQIESTTFEVVGQTIKNCSNSTRIPLYSVLYS